MFTQLEQLVKTLLDIRRKLIPLGIWLLFGLIVTVIFQYVLPPHTALNLYRTQAYWFCWALLIAMTVVFTRWLLQVQSSFNFKEFIRTNGSGLLMVVVASAFILSREPRQFKVFADEPIIAGITQQMYLSHNAECGDKVIPGFITGGDPIMVGSRVDKRPPLLPFIASIFCNLTSYTPDHVWDVNAVAACLLLLLSWFLGYKIAGKCGGLAMILLWCSVAQLSRSANSMGLETLNLTLIVAITYLALIHLHTPRTLSADGLLLLGVALAMTRYESILFLGFIGLVLVAGWVKQQRIQLTSLQWLIPVLLVPLFLLNQLYSTDKDNFQTAFKGLANTPFSVHYVPDNFLAATRHFFTLDFSQPNSALIGLLGSFALVFVIGRLVWLFIHFKFREFPVAWQLIALLLPFMGLLFGIILCFNYGQLDVNITQRLALPIYFIMILMVVLVAAQLQWKYSMHTLNAAALVFVLFHTLPQTEAHLYTRNYPPSPGMDWVREFIQNNKNKPYLILSDASQPWIAYDAYCAKLSWIQENPDRINWFLKNLPQIQVLVFQRFSYDPGRQAFVCADLSPIPPFIVLGDSTDYRVSSNGFIRLTRVVGTDEMPASVSELPQNPSTIEEWSAVLP